MLKFRKSECSCMICGTKERETERITIVRNCGDNLISFSVCKECCIRLEYELNSHNKHE